MMLPSALYTDHYQISMLLAAWRADREAKEGAMEFFCRSMPPTRRYLVMSGVARIVELLQSFSLDDTLLRYVRSHPQLGTTLAKFPGFVKWAKEQKFEDLTMYAMPEGEIFFPHEPVVRLSGKIPLLQMVETAVLSILNHDINVASKAARIAEVAEGKQLFEFGMRRTSLFDSPFASMATAAAGFDGTSNVAAGYYLGLQTVGTMAHSYVQSYGPDQEFNAFCNFLITFAQGTALLVDTYDIATGVLNAVAASRAVGVPLTAVRVDSGDPRETVPLVRGLLDKQGFQATKIIVSNDMDEYKIAALPKNVLGLIDGFGVGTQVVNPADCTSLGFVGKLVDLGWSSNCEPTVKVSQDPAKTTWPGKKQVLRKFRLDPDTQMYVMGGDIIALQDETAVTASHHPSYGYLNVKNDIDLGKEHKKAEGTTRLLEFVSVKSKDSATFNPSIVTQRFKARRRQLPPTLRSLAARQPDEEYSVEFSAALKSKREEAIKKVTDAVEKAKARYNA